MIFRENDIILFQGDSITDCQRERRLQDQPNNRLALGSGYALHIASRQLSDYPTAGLSFYNMGISGNRIVDAYARWKADTLALQPTVISILLGVNDTWHDKAKDIANGVEPERYAQIYELLLEWTRKVLPEVNLVLCEPFMLPCGQVQREWQDEIRQRGDMVRNLAERFDAVFIPFQQLFDKVQDLAPAEYWSVDGIHPTAAGHQKMADFWMEQFSA